MQQEYRKQYRNEQKSCCKDRQQQGFIVQKQSQLVDYFYRPISLSYKQIRVPNKPHNQCNRENMLKCSPIINHQIREKINTSLVEQNQFKNNKVIYNSFCKFKVSFEDPEANIQFLSSFQSGNLQLAVKIRPNQYSLYMRPDTNTKGYYQWFYFKVKIKKPIKNRVKFTIKNFLKANMLYKQGLTPYFRSLKDSIDSKNFTQIQNAEISFKEDQEDKFLFNLTFSFPFLHSDDQVQFSSQPPYDFTHLQCFLKKIPPSIAEKSSLCKSVMGTSLPYIFFRPKKQLKAICIVLARQHPGQSVGSWMMQGFLKYLQGNCSKISTQKSTESSFSHKKILKKIQKTQRSQNKDIRSPKKQTCQTYANDEIAWAVVPMVNIDGVIVGNNRTGIMGHDFNRNWSNEEISRKSIFPEIFAISNLIKSLKRKYPGKVRMFLDLHGHSSQPNVFAYGPPHQENTQFYYLSRVFPELLAKKNNHFSIAQCSYKISQDKKKTARYLAFGMFGIPFSYTIQSTFGVFFDGDVTKLATIQDFLKMGNDIAQSACKFLTMLYGTATSQGKGAEASSIDKQKVIEQITKKYKQKLGEDAGQFDSGSQQSQEDQQRAKFQEIVLKKIKQTAQHETSGQMSLNISPEKLSVSQLQLQSQSHSHSHSDSKARGEYSQIQDSQNLLKTQPCDQSQLLKNSIKQTNSQKNLYRYRISKKRQVQNEKELFLPRVKRKQYQAPLKVGNPYFKRQRKNVTQQSDVLDPLKMGMDLSDIRVRLLKLRNSKLGKNIVVINPYGI